MRIFVQNQGMHKNNHRGIFDTPGKILCVTIRSGNKTISGQIPNSFDDRIKLKKC